MKSILIVNSLGRAMAGVVAMGMALIVFGSSLSLAEYYAESGATDHDAAATSARQAT